jgi:hypothetical protein
MTQRKPNSGKLMRPDLWLLVGLGIAGILFFFWKFQDSFPSASIDQRLTKHEIEDRSAEWTERLGYNHKGTIESTVFNPDDDAKTFLEYELGQAQANVLMKTKVPVWNWVTRFCRPYELEDVSVALGPDGSLHYISRSFPNDAAGNTIEHSVAEAQARKFVEHDVGVSLQGAKLINDGENKQLHRMDHYFTWEDQTVDYKGGRLRTYVNIAGDKVSDYFHFLHVPERFEHKYNEIRSYNLLLKRISEIIFTILAAAVLFIFVWALASGRIRWRFVLTVGAIAAVLSVLNWVDGYPTLVSGYKTTESFNEYLLNSVVKGGILALVTAIACVIFFAALEPIYRMAFPEKVALEKIPSDDGMRSKPVFRALVAGLAVFGIHTAYVVAFYLIGQHLGFWSPLEIRETSTLSNRWPFYSAMDVGISACTMEELMYRVLAFVLFRRLAGGNFWIANFLQAAAWAFMHSDYPQEPAYARGVELTIGGLFYGYILRRYGLLATMLAHYTYDAFLGVTPLFGSNLLSDKLSALVAVAPGVVALAVSRWLIKRRGILEDESTITNAALPSERRTDVFGPEPDQHFNYPHLSRLGITVCLVGGLLGGLFCLTVPLREIGDRNVVTITRRQAIDKAGAYLQEKHLSTVGMTAVAILSDDTDELAWQYVFEKSGFDKAASLTFAKEPRLTWQVRYFRPSDPHELKVTLAPNGQLLYNEIVDEEDAPGAHAPFAPVSAAIQDFLRKQFPQLQPLEQVDFTKEERKARTDYSFTFRAPKLKVADAEFEVSTGTVGSTISGFDRGWKIPSTWKFERQKSNPRIEAFGFLRMGTMVVLLLSVLWWLVGIMRKAHVRWRVPAMVAGLMAVLLAASQLNEFPSWMWDYKTDVAVGTFAMDQLAREAGYILWWAGMTGLAVAVALASYRSAFPEQPLSSLVRAVWPHMEKITAVTRRMWLDAIVLGAGYTLLLAGVNHLFDFGEYLTSPTVRVLSLAGIAGTGDDWSPALGGILTAVSTALATVLTMAIVVPFLRRWFAKAPLKLLGVGLALDLILNSGMRYWQDYAWTVTGYLVLGVLFYIFVTRLARFNILAYAFMAYFSAIIETAATLLRHQRLDVSYPQLAVLAIVLVSPLVYTGWLYLAPKKELDILPPDKVA